MDGMKTPTNGSAKVKIVSDGTPVGTRVEVDGVSLPGVVALRLDMDAADRPATLSLTLVDVEVEFDGMADLNVATAHV
jgi:hypothetical protein